VEGWTQIELLGYLYDLIVGLKGLIAHINEGQLEAFAAQQTCSTRKAIWSNGVYKMTGP
jgi:hypothetical protein